jgi:hypothetical protein
VVPGGPASSRSRAPLAASKTRIAPSSDPVTTHARAAPDESNSPGTTAKHAHRTFASLGPTSAAAADAASRPPPPRLRCALRSRRATAAFERSAAAMDHTATSAPETAAASRASGSIATRVTASRKKAIGT